MKIYIQAKSKYLLSLLAMILIATASFAQCANQGISPSQDFDCDGVINSTDLDDDNDGVLDAVECAVTCNDPFVNGGFENTIPILPLGGQTITAASNVPGWQTTENFNGFPEIEIWSTGFNGVPAGEGNQFAELNAYTNGTLYQTFCLNGASGVVNWSLQHRGRGGVDVAAIKFGPDLASTLASAPAATLTTGTSAWQTYSGTYTIPAGQTTLVIAFQAISTGSGDISVGNFLDDIEIQIVQGCPDTDLDGFINALDLDSDNDGCSDSFESSVTGATPSTSVVSGPYGNNGLSNALETNDSPTANTTYTNTYSPNAINASIVACPEICGNGIDDDGDGIIDLADPDCRALCSGTSGNILVNPDFELPALPPGNNFFAWPILGWNGVGTTANIVHTDGVFTGGGPIASQNGIQYLDIAGGSADFWQEFSFSCNTRVFFSGYFSIRASTPSTGRIDIYRVDTVGGPLIVASSNQLNMPGIMDVWYLASGSAVLVPGTYRFQISMGNFSNFDNACFSFDDPGVTTGSYGPVCSSGGNITLTGTPTNAFGTWSGTGVTNNGNGTATFNPSGLSGQNITVTYSYLDAGGVGCNESTTISVICCNPTINAPTVTQPTCSATSGTILVNATGTGSLQYSINGAAGPFQSSPLFAGLSPGNYNIRVRSATQTTCFTDYSANPIVITAASGCPEICGNSIDDDGDGLTDCNDPDCGVGTPGPISIPTLCAGTSVTFSVPVAANATNYNWTVPAGSFITAGQGTRTITVILGTSAGNVCVTTSNANCTSPTVCQAVSILATPSTPPGIIRN